MRGDCSFTFCSKLIEYLVIYTNYSNLFAGSFFIFCMIFNFYLLPGLIFYNDYGTKKTKKNCSKLFWFKDLDKQKDFSVIELHT